MGAGQAIPVRETSVDEALARITPIVGALNGGSRVAVREALEALWQDGRIFGAWEPSGALRKAPVVTESHGKVTGRTTPENEAAFRALEIQDALRTDAGDAASELRGWWEQTAHDEVAQLTAKMIEYGGLHRATDLEEIGRGLIRSGIKVWETPEGQNRAEFEVQEHQELGIYFYLLGKFARWTAAVEEGRPVSDDTLLDIGVYVRMAQRIRAVGGWPV